MTEAHDDIARALRSRSWQTYEPAITAALRLGAAGDQLLADELRSRGDSLLAAALGDVSPTSPAGDDALRSVLDATGPGSQDLRCAALLALAKRNPDGSATPSLIEGLASRNGDVRNCAMVGLAGAGDERAWDPAFTCLKGWIRRASERGAYEWALCYLAQHLSSGNARLEDLIAVVRRGWPKLGWGSEWIGTYWPAAVPSGPEPRNVPLPDPAPLRKWAREDPLFAAPAL